MKSGTLHDLILTQLVQSRYPQRVSDGCPRKICQEIEANYFRKTWDSLTQNEISFLSSNLTVLPTDSFKYFLPIILITAIDSPTKIDLEMVIQNLIWYPTMNDYKQYQEERLNSFSISEAEVIVEIFKFWLETANLEIILKEELRRSLPFWLKKAKQEK